MIMLIKFRETFVLDSSINAWRWAKVLPRRSNGVLVTKYRRISEDVANDTIDSLGLVCVGSDKTMQIWDTPKRDFQKKYKKRIVVESL